MLLLPTPIAPDRDFYFCLGYRIDNTCSNFFHTSNTSRKIWHHTYLAINFKVNPKEIQFNPHAFLFFFFMSLSLLSSKATWNSLSSDHFKRTIADLNFAPLVLRYFLCRKAQNKPSCDCRLLLDFLDM